jgi:hypothetical protein
MHNYYIKFCRVKIICGYIHIYNTQWLTHVLMDKFLTKSRRSVAPL